MQKRKKYTKEFKQDAVRLVTEQGHRVSQVSRDLDLDPKMVRRWRSELEEEGEGAFPGKGHLRPQDQRVRDLERQVQRLEMEREILKKALAIVSDRP